MGRRGERADDDAELARAARAGSHAAFTALVARHEVGLFRFLRMRVGDPGLAEELMQDAFVRCWTKLRGFDAGRPFSNWLYKVAANLAATRLRRRRAEVVPAPDALPCGGDDPCELVARRDHAANVWRVVEQAFPPDLRSALWLFYAEGRSAAAVGEILGRSEGAVRVALFRARARLARLLAQAELSLLPP
jgi:RNA polymerase sigma-70 factor (ECF subfamily)